MRWMAWHILVVGLVLAWSARGGRGDIAADAQSLLSAGGDRSAGSAAAQANADYLEAELRRLPANRARVFRQSYYMPVPVVDVCEVVAREEGGRALQVAPLEPMGGQPPNMGTRDTPREVAVVYGGKGRLADFKGMKVAGALVALELEGTEPEGWQRCASLGAAGVIFLGSGGSLPVDFLQRSTTVPLALPRFYCDAAADVAWLRSAQGDKRVAVKLVTRWEERRMDNVICVMPGVVGNDATSWAVVQARYDGVSPVMGRAPGATNAANAAVLLGLARQIATAPAHRTAALVWTCGDAWNDRGTRAFLGVVAPGHAGEAVERARKVVLDTSARLSDATMIRDAAATLAERYSPGVARKISAALDEELLRQTTLIEDALEPARAAGLTSEVQGLTRQKQDYLAADNAVMGQGGAVATPAQEALIVAAAKAVRERWGAEAERMKLELAAVQNGPEIRAALPGKDPAFFLAVSLTAGRPADAGVPLRFTLLARSSYNAGLEMSDSSFRQAFRRYAGGGQGAASPAPRFDSAAMENSVALASVLPVAQGFSSDVALARAIPAAAAVTVLDPFARLDSPGDTASQVGWGSIQEQARSLGALLVGDAGGNGMLTDKDFYVRPTLHEQAEDQLLTVYEYAAGQNLPKLKAALVLVGGESETYSHPVGEPLMGTRRTEWYLSHADGTVMLRSVPKALDAEVRLQAFGFDGGGEAVRALISNTSDTQGMVASVLPGGPPARVMLFACRRLDAYGLFDARYLQAAEKVRLMDARRQDDASRAGIYARAGVAAIFMPRGDMRWQLIASRGISAGDMSLLLLNADGAHPTGTGFAATSAAELGPLPWRAAQDFSTLDAQRQADLEKCGISNEIIRQLQADSAEHLAAAQQAEKAGDYAAFASSTDALLALQAQSHQALIETADGVIKGVIFLLLGVVPFAYFLERLVIGAASVYKQIGWFGLFFVVMTLGLWFHPAFRISTAPIMILLAFFILILSSTVVYMLWGKFEDEIRKLRGAGAGGLHMESFQRGAVISAAIRLGLSNMRRRGLRTALTLATLVLLTFTLLCFTSVREYVRAAPQPVGHFEARAAPPAALQVVRTDRSELPGETLEIARGLALGGGEGQGVTAARWWYASRRKEETWMLPIEAAGRERAYPVAGLIGVSTEEAVFEPESRLARVPADGCYLPVEAQRDLGIKAGDTVLVVGHPLKVTGFFTADEFNQWRQLTGGTFAPVEPAGEKGNADAGRSARRDATHRFIAPVSVAIVPEGVTRHLGGRIASIAVQPADGAAGMEEKAAALARRLAMPVYASTGKQVVFINAAASSTPQDLSTVIVPMVIAGVIVLNTMLGAVAERTREIHVYTSVGLSPTHVGMLFLAEAAALGTLGVVFGYIFGQGLATILSWTHVMPGVDLNYSSMSAIVTMGLVLGVVMLSALWPAYAATRLATPSLQRDWKLPKPVGDVMAVDLPFTVNDAAAQGVLAYIAEYLATASTAGTGRFTSDDIAGMAREGTQGMTRALTARIWLAPYDLGVIQKMTLSIHPTDQVGIFDVHIELTREAGNPATWRRLNRPFLIDVRKQFLLWRALDSQRVGAYVEKSAQLFQGEGK